jgi:DNA-nicking Smr family endonuclease
MKMELLPMVKNGPPQKKKKETDLFKLTIGDHPGDAQSFDTIFHSTYSAGEIQLIRRKKEECGEQHHPATKKKQRSHPQAELDLHGCSLEEACRRTKNFIETAVHQGIQSVRIITGKGLHSPQLPVLPEAVEEVLRQLKNAGVVRTYRWEKKIRNKSGAILATLSPFGNQMRCPP